MYQVRFTVSAQIALIPLYPSSPTLIYYICAILNKCKEIDRHILEIVASNHLCNILPVTLNILLLLYFLITCYWRRGQTFCNTSPLSSFQCREVLVEPSNGESPEELGEPLEGAEWRDFKHLQSQKSPPLLHQALQEILHIYLCSGGKLQLDWLRR